MHAVAQPDDHRIGLARRGAAGQALLCLAHRREPCDVVRAADRQQQERPPLPAVAVLVEADARRGRGEPLQVGDDFGPVCEPGTERIPQDLGRRRQLVDGLGKDQPGAVAHRGDELVAATGGRRQQQPDQTTDGSPFPHRQRRSSHRPGTRRSHPAAGRRSQMVAWPPDGPRRSVLPGGSGRPQEAMRSTEMSSRFIISCSVVGFSCSSLAAAFWTPPEASRALMMSWRL